MQDFKSFLFFCQNQPTNSLLIVAYKSGIGVSILTPKLLHKTAFNTKRIRDLETEGNGMEKQGLGHILKFNLFYLEHCVNLAVTLF